MFLIALIFFTLAINEYFHWKEQYEVFDKEFPGGYAGQMKSPSNGGRFYDPVKNTSEGS